jgi:hypothetical protein
MKTELTITDSHPYNVEQKEAEILMRKALQPALIEMHSDDHYLANLDMSVVKNAEWNGTITLSGWGLTIKESKITLSVRVSHIPYEDLLRKFLEHTFNRYHELERDYLKMVEQLEIMKQAGREIPNIIS